MARKRVGQNMLVYPAEVGKSFVRLSSASGDARFLAAARNIASTYLRLQGDDGTWYLMMNEGDGTPVGTNRLQPMPVIEFLEDLYAATGEKKYRDPRRRGESA